MRRARSALLLSLVALLLPAAATASADVTGGTVAPVTSQTGWTAVASDGRGALLVTTPTRILRVMRDNSFKVVAGTDDAPVHATQVEADPTSGDVYFVEGRSVRRVHGGVLETVDDTSSNQPTIAVAPDGGLHVLDGKQVRRIAGDGSIATVATVPEEGTPGAFDISTSGEMVVGGSSGIWRRTGATFARMTLGDCVQPPDPCGDGGPASAARVSPLSLDFDSSGHLYVQQLTRVRVIDVDGTIRNVAGTWQSPQTACLANECALRGIATQVPLAPYDIAADGNDLVLTTSYVGHLLRVTTPLAAPLAPQGYRMFASDGGVFTFGFSTFHGSTGDLRLVSPIVAAASNGRGGYWFVAGDGGVFTFGDAGFFGSAAGKTDSPVVDMAVSDDRQGYAILERDGSLLSFNRTFEVDRPDFGAPSVALVRIGPNRLRVIAERPSSLPQLKAPIVHARPTPSGNGLWLVAADGGVFTQGDAGFFGSTGALRLNQPVVDLVPTPTGGGYWLLARDGGVFTFGDATYFGSMGAVRLNQPVVAGVAGPQASG